MAGVLISVCRRSVNNWRARSLWPARISRRARYQRANVRRGCSGLRTHFSSSLRDGLCSVRYSSSSFANISARSGSAWLRSMKRSSMSSPVSGVLSCKCASAMPKSAASRMGWGVPSGLFRIAWNIPIARSGRCEISSRRPRNSRRSRRSATETGCNCSKSRRASGALPNSMYSSPARSCARVPHSLSCASRMNFFKASWRFPSARNASPAPKTAAV